MQADSFRRSTTFPFRAKRQVSLFAAAFALATGLFWATMITDPPKSEAAGPSFSISEFQSNAPLNLPNGFFDAH
jgi:hypothetical protein